MDWQGKVVIVTGGAQGIGMAVTHTFARAGAHVAVADSDPEAGIEIQQAMRAEGRSVTAHVCDVSSENDIRTVIGEVTAKHNRIDCLINVAGISWIGGLFDRSLSDWDRVININLRGPYLFAKHAASHMPRDSAIVNIASTRALMSEPDTEPYSASKAGLIGLTHALAITLGKTGIRVNVISPGWIDVSAWRKSSMRNQAKLSEKDHAQHPAGRVGIPEDIAELCLYLADSNKAGFITGQNFVVDGGMTRKMIYEE
ncbi:MAG: SDR family oxidoreductase [Candidatus Hydrogenedentes bacterium]|nr:SDR family oxidoreductase [Candidatus Hydrogenedentota bacterium]